DLMPPRVPASDAPGENPALPALDRQDFRRAFAHREARRALTEARSFPCMRRVNEEKRRGRAGGPGAAFSFQSEHRKEASCYRQAISRQTLRWKTSRDSP